MLFCRYLIIFIVGYLLGNISTGSLIAKAYAHVNIHNHGSGNTGATNVLRTLGWFPSILTLLGDALKAFLAAKLGLLLAGDAGLLLGGLAAVIGHNWPVLYNFRGGKGIAASFGMILAINPWIGLCLFAIDIPLVAITRYMSIASIAAAIAYPILTAVFYANSGKFVLYLVFSLLACFMAVFSHRENIRRLLTGKENRLNFDKISRISKAGWAFFIKRRQKKKKR